MAEAFDPKATVEQLLKTSKEILNGRATCVTYLFQVARTAVP
jgi:hypothetical protein